MKTMTRFLIVLTFLILPRPTSAQATSEDLRIDYPQGWKVGYASRGPFPIYEFVPEDQDINHWQQLLTIQNFSKTWGGVTPEDALKALQGARERLCPGKTEWNVIENYDDSILYEWWVRSCQGWPAQHEIARIIDGQYNRFRIAFTAKVERLDSGQRAEWIEKLRVAEIKPSVRW